MISFLLFTGITLMLALEGYSAGRLILTSSDRLLLVSLALPFAAFFNVLLIFLLTIVGVPLSGWTLVIAHLLIAAVLVFSTRNIAVRRPEPEVAVPQQRSCARTLLIAVCMILIGCTAISSFVHAVLLPTFQYDSATNWTMRSQISFADQKIAFDRDESRGMAKPQYPFLFHALQITVNQGQGGFHLGVAPQGEAGWNDTAANAILWLLSLSSFVALFVILRSIAGLGTAVLSLTMILGIPLLSLHLSQGYADITLTQELLLSLACLLAWMFNRGDSWLMASALLVASAVWTKSEGLFFGLIPWLLTVAFVVRCEKFPSKQALKAGILAIGLSVPWPLFALVQGLLLTPHSGDTRFAFHPEGLHEAFTGLFDRGSFGIAWYVLLAAIAWMIIEWHRSSAKPRRSELAPLLWGLLIFIEIVFIYLYTPNVQFLLNAESYYRQMMLPAAMLMLACCVWFGSAIEKIPMKPRKPKSPRNLALPRFLRTPRFPLNECVLHNPAAETPSPS